MAGLRPMTRTLRTVSSLASSSSSSSSSSRLITTGALPALSASRWQPSAGCAGAASAPAPASKPCNARTIRHDAAVPDSRRPVVVRRWYSAGNDGQQLAGSRVWSFDEIKQLLERKGAADDSADVVLVDVREPAELLDTGKIPGAINIPITTAVQSFHVSAEDFEDMYGFERPSKDASLLFYCKAGVRARSAAGLAQHAGWKNVGEYPGSWLDWDAQKGPVEKVGSSGKRAQDKKK